MRHLWIITLGFAFILFMGCTQLDPPDLDDHDAGSDDDAGDDDAADDDAGDDDAADDDAGDDDMGDDDMGDDDSDPLTPYDGPVEGRVQGNVTDVDGAPLEGVTVALEGNGTQLTDANGFYRFSGVAPALMAVSFTKDGYSSNYDLVEVEAWETKSSSARLLAVDGVFTVPGDLGGTIDITDAVVDFGPNSFVDGQGQPVTGPVDVTVTHVDPTTTELRAAPGDTRALNAQGNEAALQSFGMLEVTMEANGNPVQLAPNTTAGLELLLPDPLPSGQDYVTEGMNIGLWWYDETRGRWIDSGSGTVGQSTTQPGRLAFFADVDHFTWWNCDDAFSLTCVRGKVVDVGGNRIQGAQVWAEGEDYAGTTEGVTDQAGDYVIWPVRQSSSINLRADVTVGNENHDVQQGPYATPGTNVPGFEVQGWTPTINEVIAQGMDPMECAEMPDLVIPTCVIAGEVSVMRLEMYNPALPGYGVSVVGGNGYFYEPTGDPDTCMQSEPGDLPPESWDKVDQDQDFVGPLNQGMDPIGAGGRVEVYDDSHQMDMDKTQREPGDIFYDNVNSPDFAYEQDLDVYAYGEQGGLPEMEILDKLPLDRELVQQTPAVDQNLVIHKGQPLQIETNTGDDTWGTMVYIVPDDQQEQALIARYVDDGVIEIPADATATMPAGPASLLIFRAKAESTDLPTGYKARMVGMTGSGMPCEIVE